MFKIKVIDIKNLNQQISLKVANDPRLNNPILYIKARKNEVYSTRLHPGSVTKKYITFDINTMSISPLNLYYDLYIEFSDDNGNRISKKVSGKSRLSRYFTNLLNLKHQGVKFNDKDYLVTEYFAAGGTLAFQIRERDEYDSIKYRIKEAIACLLVPFLFFYYKDSKLIYEKFSNYARDNSYYYFKYIQNSENNNKLFYIIKRDSPDLERVLPYKKQIVYFMSIKHILLILVSKYFIASESKGHAYAWRHNQSVARYCLNRKPFVFLQHGVLGLKQVDHTFFADNRLNHADLFITSSQIEKQIVLNFLGYQDKDVAVTGLARWDNFTELPKEKKIFVMPTWRVQLEFLTDEQFLQSEFYQSYRDLVHSDKIKRLLHEKGYTLHFMMHPKFVRYEKYFASDDENIKVIRQSEVPIDVELKTSNLVITDYSSIMWDALYYGCPTLLFQFDQREYLQVQGSYLDFDSDLKNVIIKDPQSLLDKIALFMKQQETFDLSRLQHKYFSYQDRNNAKRINEAITKWENEYRFVPLYQKLFSKLKS